MNSLNNLFFRFGSYTLLLFSAVLVLGLSGCNDDDTGTGPEPEMDIVETAQSTNSLSTLTGAIVTANLKATLESDGPFTVFAPDNAAFSDLPEGMLSDLSSEQLAEILTYHVITDNITSSDLDSSQSVESAQGDSLFITKKDGNVMVNGQSTVTKADVDASNGTIHIVDHVLLPNKFKNVVGIITKRYDLTTLAGAVDQAGLVSTLSDEEAEFTVFAPNNAAFDGVDLSELSQEQLADILTYHVLPAKILSGDLSDGQTATTVNGDNIAVSVAVDGTVTLNEGETSAAIVKTVDLEGTNGVVHIIDNVLMPHQLSKNKPF